ncbi:MAG: pentapeptide repeat-containing protein [Spirulinaceae cyanobacterium]
MSDPTGLPLQKPISVWQRPIEVKFGSLAQSLGAGAIAGAFGNWQGVASTGLTVWEALGLKQEVGAIAWLLVQRALFQAMSDLVKPYERDLQGEPNFKQLCEQLDRALAASALELTTDFFARPKDLAIVAACQTPYCQWLQASGLAAHEAEAIAQRLPSYFVYALNDQWRQNGADYGLLRERLETPFTRATEREQQWERYLAWLERRVDEPLFAEAFSLKQIYIPLRGYYERRPEGEQPERGAMMGLGRDREPLERVVVELMPTLLDWVATADKEDAVRVLCGGPGCGKSSFAKMFAAQLIENQTIPVLLVPLHLFSLTADLVEAMEDFIQADFDNILPPNPLAKQNAEQQVLLIFDGLDEIVMQGKGATQAVQDFVREVLRKLLAFNRTAARVLVLMTGREVVVQENRSEFRKEGQILYALPYFLAAEERKKYQYVGDQDLIEHDQRQEWWQKYGELKAKDYKDLPEELDRHRLIELTAQPLLNYLIALSYDRGEIDFSKDSNLNTIYADLLDRVYERDWADCQHPRLGGISKEGFVRVLEEIATACGHGDGRTTTISKISERCSSGNFKRNLGIFQDGEKEGITQLLTAFYFRQSSNYGGESTFEFTHKSFGEYLIVRRIVRELSLIQSQLTLHRENLDIGWDEKECLRRWAVLCGPNDSNLHLLRFLRNEIKLKPFNLVREWQLTLCDLISHVIECGMPMELVESCPRYLDKLLNALHAERYLLVTLSSCALVTKELSKIRWGTERMFSVWLSRLYGQRSEVFEQSVLQSLNHLDLQGCTLSCKDLMGANLEGVDFKNANLERANLENTNCCKANFLQANLKKANLQEADFSEADFSEANLKESTAFLADFTAANFKEAVLREADFRVAILERVNFNEANLENTNLQGSILKEANLERAILEGTDLHSAELEEANLIGAKLWGACLTCISWNETTQWQGASALEAAIDVPEEWLAGSNQPETD